MPYEYLNTRVRVMLARLLAPQQFLALLELRELPQLITALERHRLCPGARTQLGRVLRV
jgi:vacuolar-type H+-ATPase subunit C/Vma6